MKIHENGSTYKLQWAPSNCNHCSLAAGRFNGFFELRATQATASKQRGAAKETLLSSEFDSIFPSYISIIYIY